MSKKLFFILLAANLIYPMWKSGHGGSGRSASTYRETPLERLVLLKEMKVLPRKKRISPEPPPSEPPPSAKGGVAEPGEEGLAFPPRHASKGGDVSNEPALRAEEKRVSSPVGDVFPAIPACERIGLFGDRNLAETFLGRLTSRKIRGHIEPETIMETSGYWLMYPPADTLAHARENFARFEARGMDDLWLFEKGPWKGAISLGMYAEQSRAEVVAERLRQQGMEVEVKLKQRPKEVYWVVPDPPVPTSLVAALMPGRPFQDCLIQSTAAEAVSSGEVAAVAGSTGRE